MTYDEKLNTINEKLQNNEGYCVEIKFEYENQEAGIRTKFYNHKNQYWSSTICNDFKDAIEWLAENFK